MKTAKDAEKEILEHLSACDKIISDTMNTSLNDLAADDAQPKNWDFIFGYIHDVETRLRNLRYHIDTERGLRYHMYSRLYVVGVTDKEEPLCPNAIFGYGGVVGPFMDTPESLQYAKNERTRRMESKNNTKKWYIVRYDPKIGSLELVED